MESSVLRLVRDRANDCCEYCQLPQHAASITFEIDHIIARKHGGESSEKNLALSCYYCNSHKGPNIAGLDPDAGNLTRLFNPRIDEWSEHFRWTGPYLVGLTAIGRTTIVVLNINDPGSILTRQSLLEEGIFPPP